MNECIEAFVNERDELVVKRGLEKLKSAAEIERAINLLMKVRDGKLALQTSTATPTD